MSLTEILHSPSKSIKKQTSTILLTPQKRKHLSSDANTVETIRWRDEAHTSSRTNENESLYSKRTIHSSMEIFKWTFNQAAVVPCFVKDVYEMKNEDDLVRDVFWLGRVPCRTVKVIGVVVSVDQFDDMTRYKIDDGTGVIDCDCRHPKQPNPLPISEVKNIELTSKYKPPRDAKPASSQDGKLGVRLLIPTALLGSSISVQGRVLRGRGSRFLRVEVGNLSVCKSSNDEPHHWLNVLRLHREFYSLKEPFAIPKLELGTKSAFPITETSSSLPPSSPVTASSPPRDEPSPGRSSTSSPQRPRLRHPSRLRSRDLTDVTFRLYLKHYLDFAPPYRPSFRTATPTSAKQLYFSRDTEAEEPDTAGPSHGPSTSVSLDDIGEEPQYGFTLSYLRRVPMLAETARLVVRAERKRREKETRKREKEKDKDKTSQRPQLSVPQSSSRSLHTSSIPSRECASVKGKTLSVEPTVRKMKRLYQKAIRDLYAEGSIVLWDGPRRPCDDTSLDNDGNDGDNLDGPSCLWKTSTGVGTFSLSSTNATASTASGKSTQDSAFDSADELTEPDECEEAYFPVTSTTVGTLILRTIKDMTAPQSHRRSQSRTFNPSNPSTESSTSAVASTSALSAPMRPPVRRRRPPTAEEILIYLRTSNARWANLGNWIIDDALEKLRQDERVFKAGDGRWALCI